MDAIKLNLNRDFKRLYGRGKCFVHPLLVTYILSTKKGIVRYGITTGKKVGCAVKRNRARRVIDAALREQLNSIGALSADIVFVARSKTAEAKSHEVSAVILKHLKLGGLIPSEQQ